MVDARDRVLVVGAGPSGLFAACELARHGVLARVVEREPVPHRQVRATALQAATLEVLHRAGVVDAVLAASEHLGYARVFDPSLRMLSELSFAGVGCEWEFQCSLPQWSTEAILAERLVELGGVVERGVAASSLEARDDGVLVRCADGRGRPSSGWVSAPAARTARCGRRWARAGGLHVSGHGAGRRRAGALRPAARRVGLGRRRGAT